MKAVGITDPGRKRENNEDCIYLDAGKGIFLLADGMGGHQAGEVASELAVTETFAHLVEGAEQAENGRDLKKILVKALFNAHDAIKSQGATDPQLREMGTTLVAMVIRNHTAYLLHVGDSRAYLWRNRLQQLTRDHNVGTLLLEQGLARDQIPSKQFHALTRAVGIGEEIVPDLQEVELEDRDLLLLCSDGLTDMLDDAGIAEILKNNPGDLDQAASALVTAANAQGGRDNISVVLVRYEAEEPLIEEDKGPDTHVAAMEEQEDVSLPVELEDDQSLKEASAETPEPPQGPEALPEDDENPTAKNNVIGNMAKRMFNLFRKTDGEGS